MVTSDRRFLFWDWPIIDENALTDKFLGKPLYLSEAFSKRYEAFLNKPLSVLRSTVKHIGMEVLLLWELLNTVPFDLPIAKISNEFTVESVNKDEWTFYNNITKNIPINEKEKEILEYDPQNDLIEETNFFISYFVPVVDTEVKRVNSIFKQRSSKYYFWK